MLLRVVPEEGQNVLPEDSTPWAKELPSSTSHSNRSLRTEVSVAGKRNFQRGDKEAETTLEIQGRRCRDKITLGNSANSGLIARFREISVRTRVRGGAGRTWAAGQMLVLIVGGFDLSQGAVVALTSVSSALVMVAFKDTLRMTSETRKRLPRRCCVPP